jgi:hypothetical protein
VGRNEEENRRILALVKEGDILFEVQGWGSPVTLLRGQASEKEIHLAAAITVRYSDAPVVRQGSPQAVRRGSPQAEKSEVVVRCGLDYTTLDGNLRASSLEEDQLAELRM